MTTETTQEEIVDAEVVETVEAQAAPEAPAQEAPPSLTIQDLENIRNIIDVASTRGVFKTEEFAMVGTAYGKLSAFITAITPPPAEGEQEAPAPAPAAAE